MDEEGCDLLPLLDAEPGDFEWAKLIWRTATSSSMRSATVCCHFGFGVSSPSRRLSRLPARCSIAHGNRLGGGCSVVPNSHFSPRSN